MFDIEKINEQEFKSILAEVIRIGRDRFGLTIISDKEQTQFRSFEL